MYKIICGIIATTIFISVASIAFFLHKGMQTFQELLLENKVLKQSVANLSEESTTALVRVISQKKENDKVIETTLRFVEVDPDDQRITWAEHEITVTGDIIFFDAFLVKFNHKLVADGNERALYFWRRIYSENESASSGYILTPEKEAPPRYQNVFNRLGLKNEKTFWEGIWNISNNPLALKKLGIEAVHGSATYTKLEPGFVYSFKMNKQGLITIEVRRAI